MNIFKWAKIHKDERDGLVGSDQFDLSLKASGLPQVLSPDLLVARRRAREWLVKQADAALIFFSFERTMSMYVERDLQRGVRLGEESSMTDEETDTFNDLTQRHVIILQLWNDKVNEEYLKVSEEEAKAAWKKIERLYSSVYGEVSNG
jgi:hypothetical protein